MAQLLIVEDDAPIRMALARALTQRGHGVASVAEAGAALASVEATRPDLVVLDLGLPDFDGLRLLQMLRAVSAVPVIVATARDEDRTVVFALDAGADDYIVKPFSASQIDARVRAVLRRAVGASPDPPVIVGDLRIDAAGRSVSLHGEPVGLTPREFDLLLYLAERRGQVISKRELLTQVWRQTYTGADRTVDVHLSWLRRKLGESGGHPRYLHTVRGAGVKLTNPDRAG